MIFLYQKFYLNHLFSYYGHFPFLLISNITNYYHYHYYHYYFYYYFFFSSSSLNSEEFTFEETSFIVSSIVAKRFGPL